MVRDRDEDRVVTTSTIVSVARHSPGQDAPLADLVDHAAVAVSRCSLSTVTDGLGLDREDAGARLSSALGRRIVHRSSPTEHLFVDVDTGRAVRLLVDRSHPGAPVIYMAQSPGPSTEPNLYQQLVDAR